MKLPRALSGEEVVRLLNRHFGYQLRRSRGSHMATWRMHWQEEPVSVA